MAYQDNVSALCAEFDISNPIQEDDIKISALKFGGGHFQNNFLHVEGTQMNRAGRMFIQWLAYHNSLVGVNKNRLYLSQYMQTVAQFFFGDMWLEETSQSHRPLIHGVKNSAVVEIEWK
jgi:hypothetical protein